MDTLAEAKARELEDWVLDQLADDFDRQYAGLGREPMRAVVQRGIVRAVAWGLEGDRFVLGWVALMLMLGASFDDDPQIPWARARLTEPAVAAPVRLERTYAAALDHLDRIVGADNEHLVRALVRLRDLDYAPLADTTAATRVDAITATLGRAYPEKAAAQDPAATRAVIADAALLARTHGVDSGIGAALCGGLAFMIGSGFATDPQVPWVAETFAIAASSDDKTAALRREVDAFIAFGLGEDKRTARR